MNSLHPIVGPRSVIFVGVTLSVAQEKKLLVRQAGNSASEVPKSTVGTIGRCEQMMPSPYSNHKIVS